MLIQCHSCNTKYRLNLEQIPRRKTFVRCKNCGTPIYIDPTEEEEPGTGVIPPPPGTVPPSQTDMPADTALGGSTVIPPADDGMVHVACPSCDSRYRVAAESVQRPGVKLKCTQCGNVFAPPPESLAVRADTGAAPTAAASAGAPAGREMPLPDEQRVDRMFDDLRPGGQGGMGTGDATAAPREAELGTLEDDGFDFHGEPPAPNAEQAYLDAVALDEDEPVPSAGTVPEEQKHRFFLNPKDYQGSDPGMADPFDEQAPAATASASESGSAGIPESDAMPNPESDDLPHLPSTHVAADRDEMAQQRAVVPGQEMREITEKRVVAIVAAAAVAILVSTAAWGYWLATTGDQRRAFTVRVGQPHQLIMENDLRGRYVTNQDSGKRLFVVNGVIENAFEGQQVRWIRIKGTAYADPGQSRALGTAYAYAGNQLEDDQLAQWKLPDIKAYYGFTNGRKELNLSIPSGAKVPYQLVFSDVNDEVGRTVAQIVSYHRDGRAVFIDNP